MRFIRSTVLRKALIRQYTKAHIHTNSLKTNVSEKFKSKKVRELFLKYFVQEQDHTFIHSSPVYLNNDPSLLFVNAGMNQFRSVLLNKTYPGHPFHELKRAANSQKCVRLSGKHNDLKDVGVDLYHHTFFEMLGNWSFGDYSKKEACSMAWELLTSVYGLNPNNLYVTYFGGDKKLGVPPDEECKNIWLEIGVPANHIFPFGAKDNFWEMGDTGPCGPCTEIHYDFKNGGPEIVAQKINADSPDVMEIWNLVFIQYNREKGNVLKNIPTLHVDTGMGFERLCAVLQGTQSNYDTDVFQPIFKTIQTNFKAKPYQGLTGAADKDGVDTAYRILADHSRMFSVAIADGLFPDNHDAGFVLRKIIRRAAYAANRVMKTKPGVLSCLVSSVAETLDFFPEVNKHVEEIAYVVNDEEKMFHQVINKGRKARNKRMLENPGPVLSGQQAWELHVVHGLETNVVQDLASEVNLTVDWEGYEKAKAEKLQVLTKQQEDKSSAILKMVQSLQKQNAPIINDSFKYNYSTVKNSCGVKNISAEILSIIKDNSVVPKADNKDQCILVTDKTNFYSEAGGQVADIGKIHNKDFLFEVENVSSSHGYVFHHGVVTDGCVKYPCEVSMEVDKEHRLSCSQNHTATHILNAALRTILPYTAQRSSYVGPTHLRLGFSAKSHLSLSQIEEVENFANFTIQNNVDISRKELSFEELLNNPKAILLRGEEYPDTVSVISIGNSRAEESVSIEPCCGTHVHNTADIEDFVIIPSKAQGGSTKIISAVTGKQASIIKDNGHVLKQQISKLKNTVDSVLGELNHPVDDYQELLKEVKQTLRECQLKYDVPLLQLRECEEILTDMKLRLVDVINSVSCMDASNVTIEEQRVPQKVVEILKSKKFSPTADSYKYEYQNAEVQPISSDVLAIVSNGKIVDSVTRGLSCLVVTDKTNFYAEEDDQAGDSGIISSKVFVFKVNNVYKADGYVFHDGFVEEGSVTASSKVNLSVEKDHRLACSQNHTALHLLVSALKLELPYVFPVSATAGPQELQLNFSAKGTLSYEQLAKIERSLNDSINANLIVSKSEVPKTSAKDFATHKSSLIQRCKEVVPVVTIGDNSNEKHLFSLEPCFGTHVQSTSEIGPFTIISYKTDAKSKEKTLCAVTGNQSRKVRADGEMYDKELTSLEKYVENCLEKAEIDYLELQDCLKEVKIAKVFRESNLPLIVFRDHQSKLSVLTSKITEATADFVLAGFQK
ncbi:hypothetical protein JTE90_000062, partial [Oedothorax gibbosus]